MDQIPLSDDPIPGPEPDQADAQTKLAIALAEQGQVGEAIAKFRQVLWFHPRFVKAHYHLAVALTRQGKRGEAAASFRAALSLQPDHAEAHFGLANVLVGLGKQEEAVASFRRALEIRPDFPEALNHLGLALIGLERLAEATVFLRQAVRLKPDDVRALNNLGGALDAQRKFAEAEACYEQALRLDPRSAVAHNNLGSTYQKSGRYEEALACYETALRLDPDLPATHWNRCVAWLQMGNFEQGWPEYEWRWKRMPERLRHFQQPLWDGSPLAGRTILLHLEQGLGDTFQFVRYAPLVKERGGKVLLECPRTLMPLLASCPGIDELVTAEAELPAFDVHCPLMTLPSRLGTTLATVPANIPYLRADEQLVEHWRQKLSGLKGFKIAIAWRVRPGHRHSRYKSIPLVQFAPLAELEGVHLISIQKGPGAEEIAAAAKQLPVIDCASELDETTGAFQDTAAIMKIVDLVVSPDTAVAHLAGALGVPVWVLLSVVADWRWMLKREDSPWYPTMRLFRQTELDNWAPVFARVRAELQRLRGG